MSKELVRAIAELDEKKSLQLAEEQIKQGTTPLEIVEQCKQGVEIVGEKYTERSYFLSDLVMSEEILKGIMEIIAPYFPDNESDEQGQIDIIMGTIEGDIHDLGKNIVIYLLRSAGINVLDLGVDVKPDQFLKSLKETGASVLGISVLLTFSIGTVKKVIELLKETDLRDEVTVIIGGYPVNSEVMKYTGADYYQTNADQAVSLIKQIISNDR